MLATQFDQLGGEFLQFHAAFIDAPGQPRDFVVLAVSVVVAALRAAVFVARAEHRHALGKEHRRQEVPALAAAQGVNLFVVGRTFRAAVPTCIIVVAIVASLAVGLVVLVVVGNEVIEREAVVRGDEIDARVRLLAAVLIEIGAAGQAVGEFADEALVTLPIAADGVAVFAVPLGPQHGGNCPPDSRRRPRPTVRR